MSTLRTLYQGEDLTRIKTELSSAIALFEQWIQGGDVTASQAQEISIMLFRLSHDLYRQQDGE